MDLFPKKTEQQERDKVFSEEFDLYAKRFNRVTRMDTEFQRNLAKANALPKKEVGAYINSIMPMMLGNLCAKHEVICSLNKVDGTATGNVIVATPKGLRHRYQYSKRTDDFKASDLYQAFIEPNTSKQVEAWILNHRPDKIPQYNELKSAINKNFDKKFLSMSDEYDDDVKDKSSSSFVEIFLPTPIPVRFISEERENGVNAESSLNISRLSFRFNITSNEFQLWIIDDSIAPKDGIASKWNVPKGYRLYNPKDAFIFLEARHLMPHIEQLYKDADKQLEKTTVDVNAWFDSIKKSTQKYAVLLKL